MSSFGSLSDSDQWKNKKLPANIFVGSIVVSERSLKENQNEQIWLITSVFPYSSVLKLWIQKNSPKQKEDIMHEMLLEGES